MKLDKNVLRVFKDVIKSVNSRRPNLKFVHFEKECLTVTNGRILVCHKIHDDFPKSDTLRILGDELIEAEHVQFPQYEKIIPSGKMVRNYIGNIKNDYIASAITLLSDKVFEDKLLSITKYLTWNDLYVLENVIMLKNEDTTIVIAPYNDIKFEDSQVVEL